ncbi:MAG: hypothetical protein VZR11_05925 [Succinimonas sp.]|nr:hypothetical protein [Succinimonas sp.]
MMDEQNSGNSKGCGDRRGREAAEEKLGSGTNQTRHGRMIAAWADDIHTRQLCDMTHIFIMIYESKLPLF